MFDEFLDFTRQCFRKAELPKWWGKIVNVVTLLLGWVLVWLLYTHPEWTSTNQTRISLLLVAVVPVGLATLAVAGRFLISPFLVHRETAEKLLQQSNRITELEESLEPKIEVEYEEDGQCNLAAVHRNQAHFRVRLRLRGSEMARNLIATVKAIRKDGHELLLTERVRLRFHNAKNMADDLEAMNPRTEELLDIFRLNGGLSLAIARIYNSFDCHLCNDPGTYEIDVTVGNSLAPKDFTFVCVWTGDFDTTKCRVKRPL